VLRCRPRLSSIARADDALLAVVELPEVTVMRTIRTTGQGRSQAVADAIEAVLVSELLAHPQRLWLVSPWLSDLLVIDNTDGRFAGLTNLPTPAPAADRSAHPAQLTTAGTVTVVTREEQTNAAVLAKLRTSCSSATPSSGS
jgi:hypothetical protein